jgi:hypothetical protein
MKLILEIKRLLIINSHCFSKILLVLFIYSCSNVKDSPDSKSNEKFVTSDSVANTFKIIDNRTDEEKALDALDKIQVSGRNLYSTFPNIDHIECRGTINNYEISKEEFKDALVELLDKNYQNLSSSERNYFASNSSKSQEKYKLTIYNSTITVTDTTINSEPPRNGTWLFPAILDQRDLIIIW